MSFSARVKEELSHQLSKARHCQIAELAAILSLCGKIHIDEEDHFSIRIHTENVAVARKYFTLLKNTFNIKADISIRRNAFLKKSRSYTLLVRDHENALRVLEAVKMVDAQGNVGENLSVVRNLVIQNACCKKAFIRGAFLAAGSLSDPEKFYHFEIVCASLEKAVQLQNVMEAHLSLMELANLRILKEMRGNVNRQVNCETANINKTVSAAVKQLADITYIRDTVGLDYLPELLSEVAQVRLEMPDATLKELGENLSHPVGKSGVNHRLRKISAVAESLREERGE